jgi:hypothetical protein
MKLKRKGRRIVGDPEGQVVRDQLIGVVRRGLREDPALAQADRVLRAAFYDRSHDCRARKATFFKLFFHTEWGKTSQFLTRCIFPVANLPAIEFNGHDRFSK